MEPASGPILNPQDDGKDESAARMSVDSSEFIRAEALNDDGTVQHSSY